MAMMAITTNNSMSVKQARWGLRETKRVVEGPQRESKQPKCCSIVNLAIPRSRQKRKSVPRPPVTPRRLNLTPPPAILAPVRPRPGGADASLVCPWRLSHDHADQRRQFRPPDSAGDQLRA